MTRRQFNNEILVLLTTLFLLNALLLNVSPVVAEDQGTPWPMYQHDLSHSGVSESSSPLTGTIFWTRDVGLASLTVSAEGGPTGSPGAPAISGLKVYEGRLDNKTYCLDEKTGNILWTFETNGPIYGTPAIADGKVYIGSTYPDNNMYCLDANNGTKIWNYSVGGSIWSSPTVVDSKVYFGSLDRNMYCLDAATGSWIWNYTNPGGSIYATPAVVDSKVYFGAFQRVEPPVPGNVYCLDAATGNMLWSSGTDGNIRASPTVVNGKVYVATYYPGKTLYCLNAADGKVIWSQGQEATSFSTPVVAAGKVYITIFYYNYVKQYDAVTGDPGPGSPWIQEGGLSMGIAIESDIVYSQGRIYFGSFDQNLYCLDTTDMTEIWRYKFDGAVHSPSIADGLVFVGSDDGKICAFGTFVPPTIEIPPEVKSIEGNLTLLNATAQKIIRDIDSILSGIEELQGALRGLITLMGVMLAVIPIVIVAFYHKTAGKK